MLAGEQKKPNQGGVVRDERESCAGTGDVSVLASPRIQLVKDAGLENPGVGQSDLLRSEDMVCATTGVDFGCAHATEIGGVRCGGVSSHGCPQLGEAVGVGVEVVGESVVCHKTYVCG